ncbi:MAG: hypothetical protein ACK4FV_04240 [Candidatus Nitrosocaldus sp.]
MSNGNKAYAASSITAVGSPYNLGATGNFKICVDVDTTINYAALFKPDNTLAWQTPAGWTLTIPAGGCDSILPGALGFGGFDMVGNWIFAANDSNGNPFLFEFVVTFLVVPESIIGAITAVTAPLAAFTGYRILRQKRLN